MESKRTWLPVLLIAALILTGAGCFYWGKSAASSAYQAERELNILLNRSELEGLYEIEGPIYVTGHKSPDSDTRNLQSVTTTFADREAIKELSRIAGISDTDAFYQEMFKASLSYEGMTDRQIFFSDYKEYESCGTKHAIGCISVYDEEGAREMAERMKALIPSILPSVGMDMAFAQIAVFHDDLNVAYIVPSDDAASEVIETALGDLAVFDGTSYVVRPGISRKQVLVPAITYVLEAHPKE